MSLKNGLSEDSMDTALTEYKALLQQEARGPGDYENAMWRLQSKFGLDYWKQWQLKYRRKTSTEFVEEVRQAKLEMLARIIRGGIEELRTEKMKGRSDADTQNLIVEGEAYLAKIQAAKVKV